MLKLMVGFVFASAQLTFSVRPPFTTAAFLLENGTETKPKSEAPQRQEEHLVSQGPLEARPQMRHGL